MKRVKWGLKTKLCIITSIMITVPLLVIITFSALFCLQKIKPRLNEALECSSSFLGHHIETQLDNMVQITRSCAVSSFGSTPSLSMTTDAVMPILHHLTDQPDLQGAFIADSNGAIVAAANVPWISDHLKQNTLTPDFNHWLDTWCQAPNRANPIYLGSYLDQTSHVSGFCTVSLPNQKGLLITQWSFQHWLPAAPVHERHHIWLVMSDHAVDLTEAKTCSVEDWMTTQPDHNPSTQTSLITYRNAQGRLCPAVVVNIPTFQGTLLVGHDDQTYLGMLNVFTAFLLGLGGLLIILGILLSFWIADRISQPILNLVGAAHQLTQGNLAVSVPTEGDDERATLGRAIASLARAISGMVTHSDNTVSRIALVQNEILGSCEEQAAGASEQSSAVSETSSAAAELSKSSEQIGENIKTISQMANHVLTGMEKIKEATDQTNQILTSLNEKSKQIGNITELIDDVADQTNLLAVNASIEAARAGEQGRGFTVVADQISKLADSTAKSTKDITSLVEMIQHEMSNAIIAMEQSLVGVEEEIQLAKDSAAKSREIAMSANQQISGSRQIAEAMASIERTMKDIVFGAQRSAESAGQLTGLADELRDSMTCFKVNENVGS